MPCLSQELLIKLFENNQIRVVWDEGKEEYFFCINDIVTALTGTVDSSNYLKQLRHRDAELSKGWLQIVTPLPVETTGGIQKMNFST